MVPQGSTTLNTTWIDSVIAQVNSIEDCAGLQALVTKEMASLSALNTAINQQLAQLEPVLALLTGPSSLSGVITWVENYISSVLTPLVRPYATYTTQLTELATKVAQLVSAIEAAEARILNCSITIPSL